MDHLTELEYIRRIIDGETRLFASFLQNYGDPVYKMILRIVGSPEISEELTQDVFMKAYSKLGSFKGDSRFSTWLYRIAYNTAVSEARKKKLFFPVVSENEMNRIADDTVEKFFDSDSGEEQLQMLEQALKLLPPDELILLDLYYTEDRPVAEIGEILGLSEANVKIRLYRVRKKLFLLVKSTGNE